LEKDLVVILVVEDEHLIQRMVEKALADGGFEAAIAASGEEAVTLLTESKGIPGAGRRHRSGWQY
jgi:CheY-like chemotaxis protein